MFIQLVLVERNLVSMTSQLFVDNLVAMEARRWADKQLNRNYQKWSKKRKSNESEGILHFCWSWNCHLWEKDCELTQEVITCYLALCFLEYGKQNLPLKQVRFNTRCLPIDLALKMMLARVKFFVPKLPK